jgi:hypothetical protein
MKIIPNSVVLPNIGALICQIGNWAGHRVSCFSVMRGANPIAGAAAFTVYDRTSLMIRSRMNGFLIKPHTSYKDEINIQKSVNMISTTIGFLAGAAVYSTVAALSPQVGIAINVAAIAASLWYFDEVE